jgi:hypothetical protein
VLLTQAVAASRSVYCRDRLPQQWAMTQNNLGVRSKARAALEHQANPSAAFSALALARSRSC